MKERPYLSPELQVGSLPTELWGKPIESRDKIANIRWIIDKARKFYFCFTDYAKASYCVDHNKLENSERDGNSRPPDLPPEKPVCRLGSNS